MRKLALVATFTFLGCATVERVAGPPVPRTIAAPDSADAWSAAVTGVSDAQLAISTEDERAGVIQTQWVETFTKYSAASPPSRRLMFSLRVDRGQIIVAPITEVCGPTGACRASDTLTETELAISDRLVGAVQANLRARVSTRERVDIRPQSGQRDVVIEVRPPEPERPARPDGRGPVVIETQRAGRQEVSVGRLVEVEMVGGHRVSGEIVGVSQDGILVNVGSGDPVTLWAADIAQVITR